MPGTVSADGAEVPDGTGFSVAEAARRVGVSPSTLRSWERRYGLGPTGRTRGGHRRYTARDIGALHGLRRLAEAGLPVGSAASVVKDSRDATSGRRSGSASPVAFQAATAALDPPAVRRAAAGLINQLGVGTAWTSVFVPTLQELGEAWHATPQGIVREHVVSDIILELLDRQASRVRSQATRLLATAAPGEGHTLPLHALRAALAERGHALHVLGAAPAQSIAAAVNAFAPSALVVWAQVPGTAAAPLLRRLADQVPAAFAAGPGWRGRQLPDGTGRLTDLEQAVDALLPWTK